MAEIGNPLPQTTTAEHTLTHQARSAGIASGRHPRPDAQHLQVAVHVAVTTARRAARVLQ